MDPAGLVAEDGAMDRARRNVLIAAEPGVLAGALAAMVRSTGDDVVVVPTADAAPVGQQFDIAVVTEGDLGLAPVTIVLPDGSGNAGMGWIEKPSGSFPVQIDDADRVIELLAQHVPRLGS